MKKLLLVLLFICIAALPSRAQNMETKQMEVALSASFTNQSAWEVEPSFTYYFCPYIGLTVGLAMTDQYSDKSYTGSVPGNPGTSWRINKESANAAQALFRPAVRLRSGNLLRNKDCSFTLNLEPGLYIPLIVNEQIGVIYRLEDRPYDLPFSNTFTNKYGTWLYWNVKGFVSFGIDHITVSAGYTYSNYDVYGARRNVRIENSPLSLQLTQRKMMHAGFLSVGYRF